MTQTLNQSAIALSLLLLACGDRTGLGYARSDGPSDASAGGELGFGGAVVVGAGGSMRPAGGSPASSGGRVGAGGAPGAGGRAVAAGGAVTSSGGHSPATGGVVGAGGTLGSGGSVADAGTDYCDPAVQCMAFGAPRCFGVMDCGHGQEIDCSLHVTCGPGTYCPNQTPPIVSTCQPK